MSRIWDISQPLHAAVPVWPGEPAFALHSHAVIGDGCPVNVGGMFTPLHAGTHGDAPLHYANDGASSADCELEPYIGPCVLLDVRHARGRVEVGDVDWGAVEGAERVLLRTYARFPHDEWDSDFTAIAAEVVEKMGRMGVRLIGTDAASLDPEQSKTLDAHQAVKAADMRILEGLVLDDAPPGRYELVALPLRIVGADASPVRAILREMA
ncbi:arylformamidase [Sphingopyxis sp. FD7]|jgi:arylformamidase|uniref:arylformamidase n=1 Tax=Sphingopyxis sp. FD7 TaxID=1914525 RepID=UPI000DC62433|nr:arylformamidase [Sphingopyxis sp. FD7]BBB12277.1 kynurenine formamidase [Sphingopyxis sp. FD7]